MTKVDRVALFTAMTSIVIAVLLSVALPPVVIPKPIDSVSWRVLLVLPIAVALASPLIIGLGRLVFLLPAFLASISVVFTGLAAIAIYESLNVTLDHVDPKSHSVEVLSKQIT